MTRASEHLAEITPEVLLKAYACGIFPMAESADDPSLYWVDPERRGVIPLDSFHVPRRLARTVRSDRFEIYADRDFDAVIEACAAPAAGRRKTWINERIRRLYSELFRRGHCHTIEAWRDGKLAGGLYGISLGGAFFGESMFHTETDASKVALVHLVGRLRLGGYKMLDTQFLTEHLASFGAMEIEREDYHRLLGEALASEGDFYCLPPDAVTAGGVVLQSVIQTS